MRYKSAVAFRTALEARLLQQSRQRDVALVRLRKSVVFDRLLARLFLVSQGKWLVKGGVALEYRMGDRARLTRDLDLAGEGEILAAADDLHASASIDLDDYFSFAVMESATHESRGQAVAVRCRILAELGGRRFEVVTVDVGFDDAPEHTADLLSGTGLLEFAGIPTLPLERHVAEKLHAYTRIYEGSRESTRAKDLVDFILIGSIAGFRANRLRSAITSTFAHRATHNVPGSLPLPPVFWKAQYRRLTADVELNPDIEAGYELAAAFLDPILQGGVAGNAFWNPDTWSWQPHTDR